MPLVPSSCSLCSSFEIPVGALSVPSSAPLSVSLHTHIPWASCSSTTEVTLCTPQPPVHPRLQTSHLDPLLPTQFNFTPNNQYLKFIPQTTMLAYTASFGFQFSPWYFHLQTKALSHAVSPPPLLPSIQRLAGPPGHYWSGGSILSWSPLLPPSNLLSSQQPEWSLKNA